MTCLLFNSHVLAEHQNTHGQPLCECVSSQLNTLAWLVTAFSKTRKLSGTMGVGRKLWA